MKRALLDYDSDESDDGLPKAPEEIPPVTMDPPAAKKRLVATER